MNNNKSIEQQIKDLQEQILQLQERNKQVEASKAWETSIFRIVLILISTYLLTSIVFYLINVDHFLRNALIPTIGYFLSTQSLPFIKNW